MSNKYLDQSRKRKEFANLETPRVIVKNLKDIPQPVIKVETTKVIIEKVDIEPLIKKLEQLTTANGEIYLTKVDETPSGKTYIGEAAIGSHDIDPVWRIKRINDQGNLTTIKWANGNGNFDNQWSQRITIEYI